jgi:hypothetical protein
VSRTRFHWFLPTGGDGRDLASGVHGIGIGGATKTAAARPGLLLPLPRFLRLLAYVF